MIKSEKITALCWRAMKHTHMSTRTENRTLVRMRAILSPETFLRVVKLRIAGECSSMDPKQVLTGGGISPN